MTDFGLPQLLLLFVAVLFASALTFFTGFGLAMVLTPVLLAFLPPDLAIPLVAVLHLLTSATRLALTWRSLIRPIVRWDVTIAFGIPAIVFAGLGASVFNRLEGLRMPIHIYAFGDKIVAVTMIGLVLGLALMAFAVAELLPRMKRLQLSPNWIPIGGALSGFFGGLSGHQGAIRAVFLSRLRLPPEAFVATSAVIACAIDLVRLGFYGHGMSPVHLNRVWLLIVAGALAAVTGAWLGRRFLRRLASEAFNRIIAFAVFLFGAALAAGFVPT